jgi:hypothetical protein
MAAISGISWDNRRIMETSSLDLLHLERDPSTKRPSACVCVKENARPDYRGIGAPERRRSSIERKLPQRARDRALPNHAQPGRGIDPDFLVVPRFPTMPMC